LRHVRETAKPQVSGLLNTGEVPNLFNAEEQLAILALPRWHHGMENKHGRVRCKWLAQALERVVDYEGCMSHVCRKQGCFQQKPQRTANQGYASCNLLLHSDGVESR